MKRLITKQDRDNSRKIQFEILEKNGYEKIEYKNITIFTHPQELTLKSFWGTAANHTDFFKYKTAEQMNQKINRLKETADIREKWKQDQKERNKGKQSSHAATSAAIKQELKQNFPLVKFSVKSDSFSGGDSVHISWTDGPCQSTVEKISSKYQYGSFNSMEDIYENTNTRSDIPQTKFVSENRSLSDKILENVQEELSKYLKFTEEETNNYDDTPKEKSRQLLYNTDIPENYESISIERDENPHNRNLYKIVFHFGQTEPESKAAPITEKPTSRIQIIDYSEKSFAVIGETKPIKEDLKKLGGNFNYYLSCGAGWIFSKKRLEEVKSYLISNKGKILNAESIA